jgi:glycosyltransferase involved in cell wall biosynthesis
VIENPKVSVICMCYNHNNYVVESLDSVLNQSYSNIEIIIVDDCSPDDSKETIRNWALKHKIDKLIFNTLNIGNTKSFNKALKIATGDFIIDFATDDVLLPECISILIKRFNTSKYKNLGVIFSNSELIESNGNNIGHFFKVDENKKTIQEIATGSIYKTVISSGMHICQVAMLVKKSIYDTLKGYDEDLGFEDLDFWVRSSKICEYDYIDLVLCKKRMLDNSLSNHFNRALSKKTNKLNASTYSILKKVFEKTNTTREEDFALLKRIHFEIILCFKTLNFVLLFKYVLLEIKLRFFIKR